MISLFIGLRYLPRQLTTTWSFYFQLSVCIKYIIINQLIEKETWRVHNGHIYLSYLRNPLVILTLTSYSIGQNVRLIIEDVVPMLMILFGWFVRLGQLFPQGISIGVCNLKDFMFCVWSNYILFHGRTVSREVGELREVYIGYQCRWISVLIYAFNLVHNLLQCINIYSSHA